MRYVTARIRQENREKAYRIYVTDSLHMQGQNKYLAYRYKDAIKPHKIDRRSAEEIAADVIKKAGLKVKEDESIRDHGGSDTE